MRKKYMNPKMNCYLFELQEDINANLISVPGEYPLTGEPDEDEAP